MPKTKQKRKTEFFSYLGQVIYEGFSGNSTSSNPWASHVIGRYPHFSRNWRWRQPCLECSPRIVLILYTYFTPLSVNAVEILLLISFNLHSFLRIYKMQSSYCFSYSFLFNSSKVFIASVLPRHALLSCAQFYVSSATDHIWCGPTDRPVRTITNPKLLITVSSPLSLKLM